MRRVCLSVYWKLYGYLLFPYVVIVFISNSFWKIETKHKFIYIAGVKHCWFNKTVCNLVNYEKNISFWMLMWYRYWLFLYIVTILPFIPFSEREISIILNLVVSALLVNWNYLKLSYLWEGYFHLYAKCVCSLAVLALIIV